MNRGVPSLLTALVTLLIAFAGSTRAQDFDASPHSTPPLAEPPGLAELPPPAAPKAPPGFAPPASLVGGTWNRLGPAPTVNAQLTVPPSNKVAGAVQAIAAHPTDPDILYIGAVNGGIWRTMDATSADPTWTPLTDALPSQAIGSLEFDPTDATRQTLIAGSARVSSFAARGGILIGVLYSTNGGDSWTLFGTNQFANENLTSVAARGNVLMACSDNASTGLGSGLFRSVNTGGTFTQVSGGNGLTTGAVSDLVGDPGNLNRFYAAVRTVGIFRSDDNGATWTNVTSGITGISSSTSKIEMAAHSSGGTNAVYVGVLNSSVLASMWRSTNLGASWTQLDAPSTGAQGNIHFSIVADPTNSALVYIGGQSGYFRINAALPLGSQSTSIQGANANNTTPHADSREMVFDANGNIIEGSDGGVYRRVSPQSSAGSWVSVVGDLGVIEAHDVAWDSVTHTAMTGTQDNGTHISPLNGDLVWNWISGGDGGDVAIDDRSLPGQSIRYGSSQNLGGFYRRTYDASNVQRSNVSPALTLLAGSPAISGQFVTPVEINKIDPARLAIGGANSVYESLDRGDSVTALATNFGVNRVALAYGGRLNGVANPDVIYYGSSATVRLRTTFGGPVTATAGTFPGGTVRDVVMNTNDWRQVFAIDISGVYTTPDAGTNWVNITGNLTGVGELRQLEFFHFGVADCVAVGTDVGVFISYINDLGNWTQLGSGLPATSAFDLVYSPQDSLLVVGTLGRGVYTLSIPQLFPIITTNAAALLSESCVASNGLIDPGEFVTVAFSLRNIGSGSTSNLVATLLASGGVVNPSAPQTYGVLTGGGAPVTNNFTFRADGPCGGTLTARLMLADGTADLGVASFTFPLGLPPFSGTFKQTNAAAITIPASGAATPYPSSNIISGLPGLITKVTVTLSNFTHNLPADVDVLLVSPAGQKVMLMSDAGGTNTPGTNIVLTATDSGHYDDTGFHDPAIQNYIAGDNGGGFENRNFFTFNIPTLPPGTVTSAELRVDTFTITTANASETYELRQVTNTVAALTAGGSGLTGIYSDLANGTIYGSRAFTTNEQNQVIAIPLNASAVTDIVAHAGSPFAVGGTVTTLDGNTNSVERLFAFSSTGAANVQLVLHLAAAVTLTFDDAAPTGLPTNTLNTGTFKPTDYQSGDVLPGPAPAGPYGTNLSAFNGFSPNGTWQLFVSDDTAANSGAFSNGWALSLSVAQDCCLDSAAADVGLKLTAAPDPVLVGSNLTFTIVVSNNGPATATGVVVTNDLPAGVNFVSASTTQGTINTNLSGDVIASIGSLTPGANATIAVIVKPTVEAILTTTATIKANQFDYNSFNNSDTVAPVAFLPTLSINNVTLTEGNSGTSNFVFTVTLTPAYGQAVTAQFTTEDDTAVEGSDYLATNGIVTFPPGITNQTITVKVIGDTLSESNETFMLVLNNASNATFAIDPGAEEDEPAAPDTAAVGTILDDDPLPTFQYTTNFTVVEGNSGTTNVVLALNLSAASGRNITVNFATANSTATAGSDYVSKSGAAVFPPGATTSNLTFTVNGDTSVESNEVFFVNFSAAVNATLTNTQARITILNDDGVPGNLDHFTWSAISSPQGANVPFLVTLSGLDISNNLATNFAGPAVLRGRDAGTGEFFRTNFDGGLTGFTVSNTFGLGAGLWHLSTGRATNAGHSASNSLYYGTNETINGGGNYNTGANQGVVISPSINLAGAATPLTLSFNHLLQTEANTNYDRALVEISTDNGNTFALLAGNNVAGGPIANTGGLWVPVNLDISSYAGRQIRLRFQFNTIDSAANNFEGWYVDDIVIATTPPAIPIAPTLTGTFTNGVWTGFVQVTQIATNMQLVAGDANGHTNNSGSFSVTNFNDLTINSASVVEGNSGSVTATFTVTLAPTNAAPVSVSFTTVDGSAFAGEDYVATNGTLIFMPGDTTKSITVTILGDTIVEPNENFFVALTAATNAYILDGQGAGTILNDDGGPQVSESPRNDFWIPNGTVNAVLETNGTIYLGGSFTEMGLTNVGHATAFERNAGAVAPGFPLIDRNVNAIIDDGGGGSFLGGDFFNVGGVPRVRLAHIRADRTLDTNFNANFSGIINALALDATNLYVGGLFTVVTNGVSTFLRTNFAILNPSNGAVRVFTNNPGFSSTVIALALRPPLLYLGGNFTNVGAAGSNYARARLAAINTSNNLPAAWAADTDNNVNALAVSSYVVYAGGLFTTVAGQPRFRFAALDATTGTPTTPVTHFNSTVQSLLAAGSNIYVGGFF
ncbi:MAG TPA: Calx-beta domain-containing protein, partial [Verrucomicrobiae bacterium]